MVGPCAAYGSIRGCLEGLTFMVADHTGLAAPVKVAVLDDYQEAAHRYCAWEQLGDAVDVTVFTDNVADEDDLVDRLRDFSVVIAMRERTAFPRRVLQRLSGLRLLVTTGMGNAVIDLDAARDHGVVVSGTGGIGPPTAELTWGLILGLARHLVDEDQSVRAGGWQRTVGTDLAGATLGVVGLGRLGSRVAKIGQAFGMEVIAWSQNLQSETAEARGVKAVSKDELFRTADVVTIHLVLSERTRGLISKDDLALLKPTAYLVNTSRGPIIDEDALLEALAGGQLAGAGLDVFDVEPLPADHPLRSAPRTLLTPHIGYVTDGTYQVFYREALEDIAAFLDGHPVRVLNP
jgi:phosphoglycerate dehydrogenase-like enzyme